MDPPRFLSTRKYSKAEVAHLLLLPSRIDGVGVKISSRSQVEQVMVPGAVDGVPPYCALGERCILMGTKRISSHYFARAQSDDQYSATPHIYLARCARWKLLGA